MPAGETGGGVLHAIVGTLIIVGIARRDRRADRHGRRDVLRRVSRAAGSRWVTRFVSDVMNGTPSIVVGVFAWTLIVAPQHHYSAFAGSVALAILMIPMVMRTTEELIKLVPNSLREAALALGYARWRTSLVDRAPHRTPGHRHRLAARRRAHRRRDRTAALHRARQPVSSRSTRTRRWRRCRWSSSSTRTGPYEEWHQFAWAAALVLILVVLVLEHRRADRHPPAIRRLTVADDRCRGCRRRKLTAFYDTYRRGEGGHARVSRQPGARADRSVGMRQVDVPAHAQPDARDVDRRLGDGTGAARR